jgi:hypothetical protein
MANALYLKLPNNEYMNQQCGGGPAYFKVAMSTDGQWYPQFTYNGNDWFLFAPFATAAAAQAALDTHMTNVNNGTA